MDCNVYKKYLTTGSRRLIIRSGIFTRNKKTRQCCRVLLLSFKMNYAFTFPFTFAITSSAIPAGAGE